MEANLLSWAKDWQTAFAGLIVAALMGFRWWFSARREIREDQAGDLTHVSFKDTIKMLREENDRLWRIAEWRQARLEEVEARLRVLHAECEKCGIQLPPLPHHMRDD